MSNGVVAHDSATMKTSSGSRPLRLSVPKKTLGGNINNVNGKIVQRHLPTKQRSVGSLNFKDAKELSTITTIPKGVVAAIEEQKRRTEKGKGTRGHKRSSLSNDVNVVANNKYEKLHSMDFAAFFDYMLYMTKLNELSDKPHCMFYLIKALSYWAMNSYTLPKDEIVFRIKSLIYDNIKIMNEMDDQPDTRTDEEIRIDALEEECFAERPYEM